MQKRLEEDHPRLNVLGKALAVLEAVADHPQGIGLPDLSAQLGMARQTVHRVLVQLEAAGLLVRDIERERYSVGPRLTRLSLAKAFLTDPKVLFLDEPTASLDPDIAHKIRHLLKEVRRATGLSILYTSHNMREMEMMSDRIIFLQRGRIVAQGTAREITTRFGEADLEDVFLKLARERA